MGKPAKSAAQEPLLDLDTLIERPKIAIDGERYEILSPDELSVLDSHRFTLWGRRIEELGDAEDAGEEGAAELDKLFHQISAKVMVRVPERVQEKLTGTHRRRVVEVFTALLLSNQVSWAVALAKAIGTVGGLTLPDQAATGQGTMDRSTGAKSSPDSSASTAANRTGGSGKRR